jgi:hypothetical protein
VENLNELGSTKPNALFVVLNSILTQRIVVTFDWLAIKFFGSQSFPYIVKHVLLDCQSF